MRVERDSQRSKVYKAEQVLEQYSNSLETVADIEAYIKKVSDRAPIKTRYSKFLARTITVGDGRGHSRTAWATQNGIVMPKFARKNWIVLHEVSHVIANRKYGHDNHAGHGWEFAAIYLDLVKFMMGKDAHAALKASFKEHRVRSRPKKSKAISPLRREQLLLQMAIARAARNTKREVA